jgi:hypothetical protein
MNELPTSLAGWQALADDEFPRKGDIFVSFGKPVDWVTEDFHLFDVGDVYEDDSVSTYRKLHVAKQGDMDHEDVPCFPTAAAERKKIPLCTGVLDYFPLALIEVAKCSQAGNDQHNPGKPLHWDRSKSTDEADALLRHLMERGTVDTDGIRHSAKTAWRSLSLLQKEMEALNNKEQNDLCV